MSAGRVVAVKVTAKHWEHGWELHVEGVGVTQVRTLAGAAQQAADLIETMTGEVVDPDTLTFRIDLPDHLAERAQAARRLARDAEEINRKAADESRAVVRELRDQGLSVTDAAVVMGVSRGRISQLSSS
jgi:DNA-directed RNA polymerase specialized sigma subunit